MNNDDKLIEEYIQWRKDIGKFRHELKDIIVNDDDGVIKTEKKMAWITDTSCEDWREFCEDRDIEYEGEMKLLVFC